MRIATTVLIASLSVGAAYAQEGTDVVPPDAPVDPIPSGPPAITLPETATTAESLAAGETLLKEVGHAYTSATTLSDTLKLTLRISGAPGSREETMQVAMGPGPSARVQMTNLKITSLEGRLYLEVDGSPKKYLSVPLIEGGASATLNKVLEPSPVPLPHLALRESQTREDIINAFGVGALTELTLVGADQDSFWLKGKEGMLQADVNEKSKLLSEMKLEFTPPGAPPGMRMVLEMKCDPKVSESLETPIAFDPAGRQAVETVDALAPTPVAEGQQAPTFTLQTLDGETVSLADLKGSVVVLDFWATWCGPCKKGLPDLQKVYDWAKESGKPIRVFAMNVMERGDAETRKTAAGTYWKSQNFTVPTLLDLDDAVVKEYGFQYIPTTVIVGPDGVVYKVHTGLEENMVELIRSEALAALGEKP
jgi:thiol-disulfide isomerase/thioredoxin